MAKSRQGHETGMDRAPLPLLHFYRYQKCKGAAGNSDIVLRKCSIVILFTDVLAREHEVDGTMPKTTTSFWKNKIEGNKLRDKRNKEDYVKWVGQ